MALQIRDETAGVLLLTIDNNGLICFGDGTPVNQLSIHGIGVIDANGFIVNQRLGPDGIAPASGYVSVPPGGTATLTTLPGIVPTVQLDATWPNIRTVYVPGPPSRCNSISVYNNCSHTKFGNYAGEFRVTNTTQMDDLALCPTGIPDEVRYRWM